MKATIALVIGFIIFFVVGTVPFLLTNPFDIGAFASLLFVIPLFILVVFCWKRKPWAFLTSVILAMIVLVSIPFALIGEPQLDALSAYGLVVATVLSMLIALEGFKVYIESRS